MTVLAYPFNLGYDKLTWSLQRNATQERSQYSDLLTRQVRSPARWKADVQLPMMQGADARLFTAFYDRLSRGDSHTYIGALNDRLGAFQTPELLINGGFETDVSGWSTSASNLYWNARRLRVVNSATSSGRARQDIATSSGSYYVLLADTVDGWKDKWLISSATTADGSITSKSYTVAGRGAHVFSAPASSTRISLRIDTGAGQVQDDTVLYANASVARCFRVAVAIAGATALTFTDGPTSVSGALLAGEFITLIMPNDADGNPTFELKRLVEDVDTDGSGNGSMVFEPAIRVAPAANAGIILHKAFCKMFLPPHSSPVDVGENNKHNGSLELIEDIS